MKRNILLSMLYGAMLATLTACGDDDGGGGDSNPPPPPPPPPGEPSFVSCTGTACTITGDVDQDYTLDAARQWTIDGVVKVGNGNVNAADAAAVAAIKDAGVTLTIEAGVSVKATNDATLLVTRGSKLIAEGTASAPITFSSADADFDGLGEWGGIVIQGFAPQYGKGNTGPCFGTGTVCNIEGEGGDFVGVFGGNDPADNSGVIKYVRIAEGGRIAGPNNEVNGLTLQGVGHGTVIDYVQVHSNLDDGIEWFGGTVNAKHLVLTSNDDDDLDYDEGYQGNVQFAIIRKNPTKTSPDGQNDPRMIEANSSNAEYVPQTSAVLANITAIGSQVSAGQRGFLLRGAVTTSVYNSALTGVTLQCVDIDDADADGNGTADANANITMVNVLGDCQGGMFRDVTPGTQTNVQATAVNLDAAYGVVETVAQLTTAPAITAVPNGSSFTFEPTTYIGAVAPGTAAANAWWKGWTLPGTLEEAGEEQPAAAPFVNCTATTCTMTGDVTQNYTMVASREWVIDGVVKVGNGNVNVADQAAVDAMKAAGVTLTIRPGVNVKATDDATLLVTRGSKLIANGTREAPITFSSLDDGFNGLGEWGGIVIQGFAPQFGKGNTGACFGGGTVCNVEGEGGDFVGVFGGNDPADNSGVIKYVRIAEGGRIAGPNNEVNGLTLQGVGHGTVIDYVQVHSNLDDGIEWFGGSVNATHLVLTSNDDDDLDYDEGYQGNIQYVLVRKDPTKAAPDGQNDPRMIEANSSNTEYVPQTSAALANITAIGSQVSAGQRGFLLRGAVSTSIYNSALSGVTLECIDIDDAVNNNVLLAQANIVLVNVLGSCDGNFYRDLVAGTQTNAVKGAVTLDPATYVVAEGALTTAPAMTAVSNGSGFAFDPTNYIGAVAPGTTAASAWWSGWTLPATLQ